MLINSLSKMPYRRWFIVGTVAGILCVYFIDPFKPDPTLTVEGHFAPEFSGVVEALQYNIRSGKEKGAGFAVYHKGEALVDIWAGHSDEQCNRRWSKSTITQIFSAGKGVTAIVIAHLIDGGHLQYTDPASKYWPGFAQNGKDNITVEMLLTHKSGLAALDENISILDLVDNSDMVEKRLERQTTAWPAGSMHSYHALTYGLYLDRLVQKVDPKHRDISQYFKEEIAEPFGIDLSLNLPKEQFYRTARLETSPWWQVLVSALFEVKYLSMFFGYVMRPASLVNRAITTVRECGQQLSIFNNPDLRSVTLTSISGTGSAGSLAKLYSIVVSGEFQGRRILSEAAAKKLSLSFTDSYDFAFRLQSLPFGYGTQIRKNPFGNVTFGHTGFGGQVAFADINYNIGVSYLTNYLSLYCMADDPRFLDLEEALYKSLDTYFKSHRTKRNA